MKVLIFGATGTVGRELVSQAIEQGHRVTAFTRDRNKLTTNQELIEVIEGDVMDPAALDAAVRGHDAVLVALGAGARGGVRSTATRNIIRAMKRAGVRRLICLSTLGVGDSQGNLNFFWKHVMFGLLLRKAFADHVAQERFVKESGLDWTIVRPGAYTDGDLSGRYRHGFSRAARGLKLKVSRADVAHFILGQVQDDTYLCATPGLSY